MKPKYLYKFLRTGMKSENGNHKWKKNVWYKENNIDICERGFHASKNIIDALNYVKGEILAKVEVRGDSIIEKDKECWSEMRILETWKWNKKKSLSLAIYAAELSLPNFKKEYY